jgi:hypothetical protein
MKSGWETENDTMTFARILLAGCAIPPSGGEFVPV